jgi:hypothetical protein
MSDQKAQTWMHPWLWLGVLMIGLPACLYLPTHLILLRAFPRRELAPAPDGQRLTDGVQEPAPPS